MTLVHVAQRVPEKEGEIPDALDDPNNELMRKKLNPGLNIEGILLTMFDSRTNLCAQVVQEVRSHFPNELFETMIPRNVRLSEAPSYGLPIHLYDARCIGAKAYTELAQELIDRKGV